MWGTSTSAIVCRRERNWKVPKNNDKPTQKLLNGTLKRFYFCYCHSRQRHAMMYFGFNLPNIFLSEGQKGRAVKRRIANKPQLTAVK